MAYSVAQVGQASVAAGATSVSRTLGAPVAVGQLGIVALLYSRANAGQDVGAIVVNDDLGNFYVQGAGATAIDMTTTFVAMRVYYAYYASAGTPTITATFTGGAAPGQVQRATMLTQVVQGFATGPKFDAAHGAVQASPGTGANAISSGNATTTVNGDYIFAATGTNNTPGAVTAGTGYTIQNAPGLGALGVYAEDQTQAAAGAIAGTFTQATNPAISWFTVVAGFADAAVTTSSRLSQEAVEVVEGNTGGAARLSQLALEVADQFTGGGGVRLSQIAVEVLHVTTPPTGRSYGTVIW